MLLIAIVALISTTAYYRQAKRGGVHPGKAACAPFVAAGIFIGVAYVGSLAIAGLADAANATRNTSLAVQVVLNLFLLAAYLMLIERNWRALKNAATSNGNTRDG